MRPSKTKIGRREYARKYRKRLGLVGLEKERKFRGMPEPTRPCPEYCEACGRKETRGALCLDHDHETGEFRGWLCHLCNRGLGQLGDSIEGVKKMLSYLERVGRIALCPIVIVSTESNK